MGEFVKVKRTDTDRLAEGLWLRKQDDPRRPADAELLNLLESLTAEDAARAVRWAYDDRD